MNSDIHALSGAYVVDALDDLERARFETHLADCADCREEVRTLSEAASILGASASAAPPHGLRDRVLADIATVRPLPPVARPVAQPVAQPVVPATQKVVRRRRWVELVAAAAAVIALGTGVAVWQPWDDGSSQQLTVAEQVVAAPDAAEHTVSLEGGAQVTLVRSASLGKAVVETEDMPSPPSGKVYELWLQNAQGVMEPAGLMPIVADQQFVLDGDAAAAVGAGITVEPEAGSKEPTSEPIALIDFKDLA